MNIDITTLATLAAGAGAVTIGAVKDLLLKVAGPTADQMGQDTLKFYRLLKIADRKLPDQVSDGGIHARVFRKTCENARDFDDAFAVEYFGGILASSRVEDSNDDSAMPFIKKIEELSTPQLRLHFATHYQFAKASKDNSLSLGYWKTFGFRMDLAPLGKFIGTEDSLAISRLIEGLATTGLIGTDYTISSNGEILGYKHKSLSENGVYVTFKVDGLRLFMRALGLRGIEPDVLTSLANLHELLSSDLELDDLRLTGNLFKIPYTSELSDLATELVDTGSKIDSLQSELEDAKSELDDAKSDLEERGNEIKAIVNRLDKIKVIR